MGAACSSKGLFNDNSSFFLKDRGLMGTFHASRGKLPCLSSFGSMSMGRSCGNGMSPHMSFAINHVNVPFHKCACGRG